ncbi:hypothetical protein BLNAU_23601 [Blattamonas nauphoetae]|uniref:Crinkler (CRN) family protein n=1 Tax=Blattamonas nauphoetae TaxID=2049346 RepID=A0ABQ9WQT7_9EUKA|nr:hypothetical protein BLNAU_23601 [Blattamonas nauphoetae]
MTQPEPFEIPYQLVAGVDIAPVAPFPPPQGGSPPKPPTIDLPITSTISNLYQAIGLKLIASHKYITIQFPCTKPPSHDPGESNDEGNPGPPRAARNQQWINLVGYSGFEYDSLSMPINDLKSCWPKIGDEFEPIKVIAIPSEFIQKAHPLAKDSPEVRKERLHLMRSLYDLFYTEPADRIMQMSTLDSNFQTRRNVWIRDCWEEFQIGVIAHFEKFHGLKTFTDEVLETLQQPCFPNETIRLRARDQALWMSIEKTPDWIYSKHACVSPFPSFVVSGLKGEDTPYRAFYVDGQPGTGKSQMLLYLINRLMKQIPKMAIYYVLPNVPIFTILVDRSDPDNPIRVQFHITSLYEDWCTSGFPTIRIVDSVSPFAKTDIDGVFTVYAASHSKFEKQVKKPDHVTSEWRGKYPLWTDEEFYTMMRKLDLTHRDYWIRPVNADSIVTLHPMVVTLLGAHGYLVVEPGRASGREAEMHLNDGARSQGQTLPQPLSATAITNVQPPVTRQTPGSTPADDINKLHMHVAPESSSLLHLKDQGKLNGALHFVPVSAMDGSTSEGSSTPPTREIQKKVPAVSYKKSTVFLNVIEVFGLSPRALSSDLNNTFNRMSEVFGWEGKALEEDRVSLVISSLSATHLGGYPVSMFASRLKTAMTRFHKEYTFRFFDNNEVSAAVKGILFEHTVNQELLRSHAQFTIFPASPGLPTYHCRFPVIDRCPMRSEQLSVHGPFQHNVLYYESLYDPVNRKNSEAWPGIDSFIYFLVDDHIKLFTFQITVNPEHKDVSFRLIQSLKGRLARQYAITLPEVDDAHSSRLAPKKKKKKTENREVEVYFIWIVKPKHVPVYQRRTRTFLEPKRAEGFTPQNRRSRDYLTYKIGVVSVTDLLFNEHSGMDRAITEYELRDHKWTTDNTDFKACFVMMEELTVNQNERLEVEERPNPLPEPTEAETAAIETADDIKIVFASDIDEPNDEYEEDEEDDNDEVGNEDNTLSPLARQLRQPDGRT